MLLILFCLFLFLATVGNQTQTNSATSLRTLFYQMNENSGDVCTKFNNSFIYSMKLKKRELNQQSPKINKYSNVSEQLVSEQSSALESITRSNKSEIPQKNEKQLKEKSFLLLQNKIGPNDDKNCSDFLGRSKQEFTSVIRHQNSKSCHMLQEQAKFQSENPWNKTLKSSHLVELLPYCIVLSLTVVSAIVYFIISYNRKQRQVLQQKLQHQQLQKQALRVDLRKQILKLKQKSEFYEIFWDQLVDEVHDKNCYDHLIYEGRFLNQQTFVYVIKIQGTDILTVERKLSKLLTCSHSRLSKLYFYVRNQQHLLVFTEKIKHLASQQLTDVFNLNANQLSKRNLITQIIETLNYLEEKIQLKWLPLHSIQMEFVIKRESSNFEFKINAIPCLFRKMPETCGNQENDTCSEDIPCFVRTNIAALFHLILMNGKPLVPCELKKAYCIDEQYIQFLNFILYEAKAIGHTHQHLFNEVKEHPLLWDTTRKILFISDFSNFIETHLDDHKIQKLEEYAQQYYVIEGNWGKPFHTLFAQQINNYRKYDFSSIRDLVRMIRNKINHFHQIPKDVRIYVGKTPQKFMEYCLMKFPKLLYFAYNYTRKKKWRLHIR